MAKLELAEYNFYMPVSLSPYFYFFNLPLISIYKNYWKTEGNLQRFAKYL